MPHVHLPQAPERAMQRTPCGRVWCQQHRYVGDAVYVRMQCSRPYYFLCRLETRELLRSDNYESVVIAQFTTAIVHLATINHASKQHRERHSTCAELCHQNNQ
jgi:hypothetical protein